MDRFDTDTPLHDDDRDLALARALDAQASGRPSEAVGADSLGAVLATRRAALDAPAPDADRVAALRARVMAATEEARAARIAADRAPARHAAPRRTATRRFAGALAALGLLVAVGLVVRNAMPVAPRPLGVAEGAAPVRVVLPGGDGTVVLDPGARLDRIASDDPSAVRVRLTGSATFDITHRPERRFEVEAAGATVAVLGTRFRVDAADGGATVVLERGRVRLSNASGAAVTLAPGQTATATAAAVTPASDADGIVADLGTTLTFRRTSARAVADALGARIGVVVRLPPDVAAETVTGTLSIGPDTVVRVPLDAFGDVLGGRFVQDGGGAAYRFERSR